MIYAIGTLFSLVWLVCHIMVLIHAFKSSILEGFACLCIPCFGIYYLFAKFESPNKGLITIGYLFGGFMASALHGYANQGLFMHPSHHR